MDYENKVEFDYGSIEEAFPACDPGVGRSDHGSWCRSGRRRRRPRGGIILLDDARETEGWNTQTAKVVAVGPLAFRNRNTMELWPEGTWCAPGDFVRVPKYGGDRWTVKVEGGDDALIVIFDDLNIVGKITGDPTKVKAFL